MHATNTIFIDHMQKFLLVKTLMWLQQSGAGRDEKLILNFMWPYEH